jgi:ABC-type phosphate transport system permease subunit
MDTFSTAYILVSFVFGIFGLGFFTYGKKQKHKVAWGCGIALMVLPYLIQNMWGLTVASLVCCVLPFVIKTNG